VSERTAGKSLGRYRREGPAGLVDRSSRPRHCPQRTAPRVVRRIAQLRRRRWTSPAIARQLGLPVSTVGVALRRLGLNRLRLLEPRPVPVRYEKQSPGELVHVDAKRLMRFTRVGHRIHGDRRRRSRAVGWEHVHVCIDDATRLAYAEILPKEDAPSAAAFLQRALAWLAHLGVRVHAVMTDNALAYTSHQYRAMTTALGLRHLRTRPYTPRTNGKAERFIQTCLREWVYDRVYRSSQVRGAALPAFLRRYNVERPHTALQRRPPLARLLELSEQRA
jgi:transposase InsO family protein